jgi:hypothetical protein
MVGEPRQLDLFSHCDSKSAIRRSWKRVRKELPFAGYSVVKEPPSRSRAPAWQRPRIAFTAEIVVENTGLEPVTSWLQTRRSPS